MINMEVTSKNNIYILFSRQNTKIGRLIRVFLPNTRYTHVAVAADDRLQDVYSFARYYYHSPFNSGLIKEYPSHYLIKGRDLTVKLCKVTLADDEYAKAICRLDTAIKERQELLYNLFDAIMLPIGRRIRIRRAYTCVSFGAFVLGYDDVGDIAAFENRIGQYAVYEGSYKDLVEKYGLKDLPEDNFYKPLPFFTAIKDFFILVGKLLKRGLTKTV